MAGNPIFDKLKNDLRLVLKKTDNNNQIVPGLLDNKGSLKPIDFLKGEPNKNKSKGTNIDPFFKRIWDWWLNNTYDKPDSFNNRLDRYNDLNYAYYNSGVISTAVDLCADETLQVDSQQETLDIYAKNKTFEKAIKDFFNNIGINKQKLSAIAHNIALESDSFLINSVSITEGITKIQSVSPTTITQRLEFTLARAIEEFNTKNSYTSQIISKSQAIKKLFDIYKDKSYSDISQMFESYLFGFMVGDYTVLPPWAVTHFRRMSNESEFYPFGKPVFIHAIAPYRQYAATKNLVAMARVASFPIMHFQVDTSDKMTESEKWEAVNETMIEFSNLGVTNTGKDEFTINDKIWTPKDLLEVTSIENRIDLKSIDDLELFLDELLTAVRIPKGYIPIGSDNGWGDSGKALVQQSKMFARLVYINQQAIIQGLIDLVKVHFTIRGEFIDEPFEISMPYPIVEETSDRQRLKTDSIRLAKDILDNLGQALGLDRDETLPTEIVLDVFSKFSILDYEDLEKYIDIYKKEKNMKESILVENIEKHKKREKELSIRYFELAEHSIREAYFESVENLGYREGVRNKRHFILSTQIDPNREVIYEFLKDSNSYKNNKLHEKDEDLINFKKSFSSLVVLKENKERKQKNKKSNKVRYIRDKVHLK